jgi:hypothetical protein
LDLFVLSFNPWRHRGDNGGNGDNGDNGGIGDNGNNGGNGGNGDDTDRRALTSLNLASNSLGVDGAKIIAACLPKCT